MKLGLFLTAGASRTAYQVGALYALVNDCGLQFDVIAGTSAGAVHGVFAALGQVSDLAKRWTGWTSSEMVAPDWKALLRGALFWSPSLMRYIDYSRFLTEERLDESKLPSGLRYRINLANLTTGDQDILEYPGAEVPLVDAVRAAVAVPAVIPPQEFCDQQWVDGLTVDGFPLESLVLETGVDRVFVLSVAPRKTSAPEGLNAYAAASRAIDWNQQSETIRGLAHAALGNARIAAWKKIRKEIEQAVEDSIFDAEARAAMRAEIEQTYTNAGFPYARDVVEVIPVLPEADIEVPYATYDPATTLRLIAQGRKDARAVVQQLAG